VTSNGAAVWSPKSGLEITATQKNSVALSNADSESNKGNVLTTQKARHVTARPFTSTNHHYG